MKEFDQVYQKHSREIFTFLFRMLGSEAEARELTQETFLTFLKEIRTSAMPQAKQRPWLYRVAKNKALNMKRDDKFRMLQVELHPNDTPGGLQAVGKKTPEEELEQAQERRHVRDVLGQMKEREASLLQFHIAGLSYAEIATAMSLERSTIGKALARARVSFEVLYKQVEQSGG